MATLSMTSVSAGGTLTQGVTLSDTDTGRVVAMAKARYGVATNAQAFNAIAQDAFARLKNDVLSYEQQVAAAAAAPITLT